MAVQPLSITPNANGFGAQVEGVNLSEALSGDVIERLTQAIATHSVLWFPNQPLTHEALEAFTLQFGDFGNDLPFVAPLEDQPRILEIRRNADEKTAVFGGYWHSDGSFQEHPPALTILHAKIIPPTGGDTLFADGYRAYDALNPRFREELSGLSAIHSATGAFGGDGFYAKEKGRTGMKVMPSADAEKTRTHPLVRTHPVSGRRALFVNPVYTVGVEGLSKTESDDLLAFLYRHMVQPRFVYRHAWRPDMLTMWDNRCAMHNATGGYDGFARVLHRTIVSGEKPSPAGWGGDSSSSKAVSAYKGVPLNARTLGRKMKRALTAVISA